MKNKSSWEIPRYYMEITVAVILILVAVFLLVIGPSQVKGSVGRSNLYINILLIPNIVLIIVIINALNIVRIGVKEWRLARKDLVKARELPSFVVEKKTEIISFFLFVVTLLCVILIYHIGLIVCIFFLTLFASYLFERKIFKTVIISLCTTLFIFFFSNAIGIVLPMGRIIYRLMY